MKYNFIISIDPGVRGGISILSLENRLSVYSIPVKKAIVNKKTKNIYDIEEIIKILKPFSNDDVLFIQEKVSSHPGEGSVSAFGFGKSAGLTLGIAFALGFKVVEISSQKWKKHYPSLNTDSIIAKKEEMGGLRKKSKTLKDKNEKKANTKEIDRLSRQIKAEAKRAAIDLVKVDYPDIDLMVKRTESDGLAESVLIAKYGLECCDELVKTNE